VYTGGSAGGHLADIQRDFGADSSSELKLLEEGAEMPDKPREWPNKAMALPDAALDEAIAALRAMIPLTNIISDPQGLRRLIEINKHLDRIKDLLVEAGAPYRSI